MPLNATFGHISIVARDWQKLAQFYQEVFNCTPASSPRDLSGSWLEKATGILGAHLQGIHLRLPGHGPDGPTLEIFQYRLPADRPPTAINRPGLAHIAFAVEDVAAALDAVKAAGGGAIGEIASLQIAGAGIVTLVYATDPEGNIIELQKWSQ